MSDLKPCPFCGSKRVKAYVYHDAVYRQYAVRCGKCGARIMKASTELAIEAWNRRAEPEQKKGTWEVQPSTGDDRPFIWWKCSECGHVIFSETERDRKEFHAYCGRCGSDMRGE